MKNAKIILLCAITLYFTQTSFSQLTKVSESIYTPTREQRIYTEGAERNERTVGGKDESGMIRQPPKSSEVYKRSEENSKEIIEKRKDAAAVVMEDIADINKKLNAPQYYLNKYPEYANGKNSGIFRLFPDKNCGKGRIVYVKELERCGNLPQILGFGSKMSFRLHAIPNDRPGSISHLFAFPDIQLTENTLKAGNEIMETLITEMGNLDIDKIDDKAPEIQFLKKWKKSNNKKDFVAHRQSIAKGINDKGQIYSSSAAVKLNSVYMLRSIYYYNYYPNNKTYWNTDLIVAFKIVGQEKDGGLIIIWKQLRKKEAPSITG